MFGKETEVQANPKEIVFSKTKGFGHINYAVVTSKVNMDEMGLSVERTSKIHFFKGKPKTDTVEYGQIANVEIKTNFAKGDFISGIVLGLLAIIITLTSEDGSPGILTGLVIIAALLFCAYGKNIIITKNDSSKIIIMSEGWGEGDEIESFRKQLVEHNIAMRGIK